MRDTILESLVAPSFQFLAKANARDNGYILPTCTMSIVSTRSSTNRSGFETRPLSVEVKANSDESTSAQIYLPVSPSEELGALERAVDSTPTEFFRVREYSRRRDIPLSKSCFPFVATMYLLRIHRCRSSHRHRHSERRGQGSYNSSASIPALRGA